MPSVHSVRKERHLRGGLGKTFCLNLTYFQGLEKICSNKSQVVSRNYQRGKLSCLSIRLRVKNVLFAGLYLDYH